MRRKPQLPDGHFGGCSTDVSPEASYRCGKRERPADHTPMKARDGRGYRLGEKSCRCLSPPLNWLA